MRESRETDEVLVCMAQRLQSGLERQLTLVERLQSAGRGDETVADLAELRTTVARSLRGCENLLVLGGAQQGPRVRGPRTVADVLADARAGVDDAPRVALGPAPQASVAPRAVAGLVALFTELFTHGLATGGIDVTSRRADDGGLTVEVATDGPGPTPVEIEEIDRRLGDRPIIDDIVTNRVGLFVAARLARRSGATLRVAHRRGGTLAAAGLVAVVHCPRDLLDAVDLGPRDAPRTRSGGGPNGNRDHGHGVHNGGTNGGNGYGGGAYGGNGSGHHGPAGNGYGDGGFAAGGHGVRRPPGARRPDPLLDPLPPPPPSPPTAPPPTAPPPAASPPAAAPSGSGHPEPSRRDPPRRAPLWDDLPLRGGPADELFGPMTSSLRERMRDNGPTPIYEAVASAWFVDEHAPGPPVAGPPADWSTPSDAEWRAASERAARPGPEQQATPAGLPRRRPGTQMVAPPRHGAPTAPAGSTEREPERVRERLAVYQQGLERGRHRASDQE